jgi:hypothetical protein
MIFSKYFSFSLVNISSPMLYTVFAFICHWTLSRSKNLTASLNIKLKEILREGSLLKSKQVTPVEVLLLKNTIQLCREIKYVVLDLV